MAVAIRRSEPTPREIEAALEAIRPGESFSLDRPITVEEFYELAPDESKLELVNGVVTMPSPVTLAHEELFGWLYKVIGLFVEERRLGRVYGSRTLMRIDLTSAREPDIAVVLNENLRLLRRLDIDGPADFVVEIVDSTKSRRAAVVKQAQYETLGVPELWVVDLPREQLRHFVLNGGRYEQISIDPEGEAKVRVLPGFRLRVAWLFQGPQFPSTLEVVRQLLQS